MRQMILVALASCVRRGIVQSRPLAAVRRLSRARRGAATFMFAAGALTFLGLAGLATEGGYWYLAHRNAQNAADASAMAGAMAWAATSNHNSTVAAVSDVATRNGFTTGGAITVTPNHPPASPSAFAGDNTAVQAVVAQVQNVAFARLFGITAMTVSTSAVAKIRIGGDVCILTLTGQLTLSGTAAINAPNCALASNNRGSRSIDIGGSSSVLVQSMHAAGNCSGCASNNVTSGTPYTSGGAPVTNPYAQLDTQDWGAPFQGQTCINNYIPYTTVNRVITLPPFGTNGGMAYCNRLGTQSGDTLNLSPGTYIFYNADVSFDGGLVQCTLCSASAGVSIVLIGTGNSVGKLSISANTVINLTAGTNPDFPILNGVLFYRAEGGTPGISSDVSITGGDTSSMAGGFYFPGAKGNYSGNATSLCTVIVGGQITLGGVAGFGGSTSANTENCAILSTAVPQLQSIVLVE